MSALHFPCVAGKEGGNSSKKRKRGQAESASGLHLSLRPSHGAWRKAATSAPAGATSAPETLDLERLKKGQQVRRKSKSLMHHVVASSPSCCRFAFVF